MFQYLNEFFRKKKENKIARHLISEMEGKTMYISNDIFDEVAGIYIPENYNLKFFYSYDGSAIISFDLVAGKFLFLNSTNENMILILKSEYSNYKKQRIKDSVAKRVFEQFRKNSNLSCFYNIIEDEVCIDIKNGFSEILDFLKDYKYQYYFTLYKYDFKIIEFESYAFIKNYVKSVDYSISYTFEMGSDWISIAYNENYVSSEKLENDFKKVCDELGLILVHE